jgi:DNA-binding PadR family transcriptional regulator
MMSIKYIILGYLSWRPMSGYDVKKIIADSETLPWSANNNQIYRALVELHRYEWVTKTVETQVGSPNRHVYAITASGVDALKQWVVNIPDAPETKNALLEQLQWADYVGVQAVDELLQAYLNTVGEKLFFLRVQADEKPNMPDRTPRETYLWEMIQQNWIAHYELELKWVREIRHGLQELEIKWQRQMSSRITPSAG